MQAALANIRKNKKLTTITVAHRLSTIISSDQIAVISDGEIAELGTHASLIDEGGIYANLCESQGITKESLKGESSEGSSDRNASLKPTSNPDDIESGMRPSDNVEKSMVNSEEEEEALELSGTRKHLWQYNKPEWCYIVIGVIGAMVTGVLHPSEGKKRHGAVPGDRSLTPFV